MYQVRVGAETANCLGYDADNHLEGSRSDQFKPESDEWHHPLGHFAHNTKAISQRSLTQSSEI